MIKILPQTLLRILALPALAGLAALVSNSLASPSRKLAWVSNQAVLPAVAPPVGKPTPSEPGPPTPTLVAPKPKATPHPITPARRIAPKAPAPTVQAAIIPIREISSEEAWAAFNSGQPFLDARRSADFEEGHIAGAWSTPIWESDVDDRLFAFKFARKPASEDPIVIYCSGGDCRDSHLLAAKLLNDGYIHLLIYRDGYPDWAARKRPVEKGHS
ncbi:MAG TPA: rhodanese-like domain-containing protein [Geothrix sp.]|nr:rhodanese-like domain-containing protein [Geothrix sp.]